VEIGLKLTRIGIEFQLKFKLKTFLMEAEVDGRVAVPALGPSTGAAKYAFTFVEQLLVGDGLGDLLAK
jgi:hypothetical protein